MFRFLLGIAIGLILLPAGIWLWFSYGHPPVAVADGPLPAERFITSSPLNARIDRDLREHPKQQGAEANEATFIAGAHIYRQQCAFCHGVYGNPSKIGASMFPDAPQLWEKHHNGEVVGVSDDPPAETYWKVANGIRLTGMPAYSKVLSEIETWQVSVLLANADKPLPPAALQLLKAPVNLDQPAVSILTSPNLSATPISPPRPIPR
jgi:thiosulfate dehydrogenase